MAPADVPAIFHPRVWDIYLRWGRDVYLRCFGDVYLRWFRLHSARVNLSIPPVAPADVPAIFHPRVGDIYLRWGRDVYA